MTVLRSTPNAKVGSGLTRARAEEEKVRFIKAGLYVDITPVEPTQTKPVIPSEKPVVDAEEASLNARAPAEFRKEGAPDSGGLLKGRAGFIFGAALATAMGLLYLGEKGVTIAGMSLPWGKKPAALAIAGAVAPPQATNGVAGAGNAAVPGATTDLDADDALIQAARKSGGAGGSASGPAGALSKPSRQILTAEFASLLAEIGQGARARAVLQVLAGNISPTADPQAGSALQAAQLKLQAWAAQRMDSAKARMAADDLKLKTQTIANAQERAQLQAQLAVIFSRNAQLSPDVARLFLILASESLKGAPSEQTNAALGDLTVLTAEVLLNETTASAKAAAWTQAKASAGQIEDLFKQAPDGWAQFMLYAIDYQAKQQTGQIEKAAKSLQSALTMAAKNGNLTERAVWLRGLARLSDASLQEPFEAVTSSLQAQLIAKSGTEKARGLTELSLLYTAAGLPGRSAQLRSLAQATNGLSAADSQALTIDLVVRNDMAMAKMLHGLGRYAESEVVLQRVGGYLF